MYSEINPRDIILGEMRMGEGYSERLTRATCLLQQMHNGNLEAFTQARKEFAFLTEDMSLKAQYNALYGYSKWGFKRIPNVPIEGDAYASEEEWSALFHFTKSEAKKYQIRK